jgi:hypothetical protein
VTLATVLAGHPQGHALVDETIVTDDRCGANDHPNAVVDGETPANLHRGEDVCPQLATRALGEEQGKPLHAMGVEPVVAPIRPDDVGSR